MKKTMKEQEMEIKTTCQRVLMQPMTDQNKIKD